MRISIDHLAGLASRRREARECQGDGSLDTFRNTVVKGTVLLTTADRKRCQGDGSVDTRVETQGDGSSVLTCQGDGSLDNLYTVKRDK